MFNLCAAALLVVSNRKGKKKKPNPLAGYFIHLLLHNEPLLNEPLTPTAITDFAHKSAISARLWDSWTRQQNPLSEWLSHIAGEMVLVVGSCLSGPLHGQLGLPLLMGARFPKQAPHEKGSVSSQFLKAWAQRVAQCEFYSLSDSPFLKLLGCTGLR